MAVPRAIPQIAYGPRAMLAFLHLAVFRDHDKRVITVHHVRHTVASLLKDPRVPARDCLRGAVPGFGADRWLSPELAAAEELVGSGALVAAVEEKIGELE